MAMLHGVTVEEFMRGCQTFKCGCLVTYNRFGGLSSLCRMVLQLRNIFMTSFQYFKCGCLVAYYPYVAGCYS